MSLVKEETSTVTKTASLGKTLGATAVGVVSAWMLKQLSDKIKNDTRKMRIIEDIALNDPLLKTVDRRTLFHWYATICYYAPTLANDKLTVTEILQNFARFGKVDFNTIKMLIETENKSADTEKLHSDVLKNKSQLLNVLKPW